MKLKRAVVGLAVAATALAGILVATSPSRSAAAAALPGMCTGRSDAGLVVIAHANGPSDAVPLYILNISTDATGHPDGSLVLGQGPQRIHVTEWCRAWQHQPGQQPKGDCTAPPAGSTTVHAVGLTELDGTTLLVRTDVRKLSDGSMEFRVRYRAWTAQSSTTETGEEGCEETAWTWVPAEEEWFPLGQMMVRPTLSSLTTVGGS